MKCLQKPTGTRIATLIELVLFLLVPASAHCAWYNPSWKYRVPVNIPIGAPVNSTLKVDVDFNALLTALGATGTFDINSPRIVRPNDSLSATQEFTDAVYQGGTDATANGRGEVRFLLEDSGPTTYYLYFDIVANGAKPANPQQPINGNFEHSTTGTQNPTGWTATKPHSNFDAQIRPSETPSITSDSASNSVSATPNPVTTDGTPLTGRFSYLLGARTNNEPTNADVTLARSLLIPNNTPGNIVIRYRIEGWDSSDNGAGQWDYLRIRLRGSNNTEIIGPGAGNYTDYPFSPNKSTSSFGWSNSGYGQYNGWDTDRWSNHRSGMTLMPGSQPWFTRSFSLNAYTGQTITLEIITSHDVDYKTWVHIDDVEWSVISGSLGTPSQYSATALPGSFNCMESGANASSGHIYTKLAGTLFNLDIVALKTDGSVETSYASDSDKTVTLEIVDGSGAVNCSNRQPVSPAVTQTIVFNSLHKGRQNRSLTINTAYPNLRCRITDTNQATSIIGCSSDNFAVRPKTFTVTSNANADISGISASATPAVKSGADFTLTAASGTPGYNTAPRLDGSKVAAHNGAINTGTLTGSFANANSVNGSASGAAFTYSEVGYFKLQALGVYDDTFTAVDSASGDCTPDFSNTLSSGKYGCKFGNSVASDFFGRFIPDHFDVLLNTPSFQPNCGSFSYIGQPVKYNTRPVATVTAKNKTNNTTQNYALAFWKINPLDSVFGITPNYAETNHALVVIDSSPPGLISNGNGTGLLNFADTSSHILALSRNAPENPFNADIALSFNLVDTDGISVASVNGSAQANPVAFGNATSGNGISFTGNNKTHRWGRWVLENSHGSELLPLSVPFYSEYFLNNAFVLNAEDNCSTVNLATQVLLSNPNTSSGSSQPGNTVMTIAPGGTTSAVLTHTPLSAGTAGLIFTAPGFGNTGYVDITTDFSSMPWLLFDWDGNGSHDNSPSARSTFGIHQGNPKHIFIREVY